MPFDNPAQDRATAGRTPLMVDIHVGRQLRLARKNRHISQEALADALGLTFQQVQKYESGCNRLSASKMYAAAHFLRVQVSFFFDGLPDTLTGDAGDVAVPAAGHAMVDKRYGRELQAAFLRLDDQDRGLLLTMAQRMASGPEQG